MKVSFYQLKKLKLQELKGLKSALFYGETSSLVIPKANFLCQQILGLTPQDIATVDGQKIIAKEAFIDDLLSTQDLWSPPPKMLWIQNAGERILAPLKKFLEESGSQHEGMILITTDKYLKPASKLRQFYEKTPTLLAMGCFAPDPREIKQDLLAVLESENKRISPSLLGTLSTLFSQNHSILSSEMEKLLTYVGTRTQITQEDINLCLALDQSLSYDALSHNLLRRNTKGMIAALKKSLHDGQTIIGIIRSMIPGLQRLYTLQSLMSEDLSFEEAARSLRPPLFPQQKIETQEFIRRWSASQLQNLLQLLENVELEAKKNPSISGMSLERSLIKAVYFNSP